MITKYEFSKAALYFEPHANNVVFHQNEKHFGNTIQVRQETLYHYCQHYLMYCFTYNLLI